MPAIFLIAVTKYLRGKGGRICFGLQFEGIQSIKVWKAWQLEQKAVGHIASTARKQKEVNTGAQLTSHPPLIPFRLQSLRWCHLHL